MAGPGAGRPRRCKTAAVVPGKRQPWRFLPGRPA